MNRYKKHWSDLLPLQISPEQWSEVQEELAKSVQAQERVEGIVYLCSLDYALEHLLRAVMIDDDSVHQLMKDGQALQPFSIKQKLAYALGLIPETVKNDLAYLNKIRNAFAHNGVIKSFDEAPIRDLCDNLSTMKRSDGTSLSPRLAYRMAATETIRFLLLETGQRLRDKNLGTWRQIDSVESRYAAYLDTRNQPPKREAGVAS